MRETNAAGDRHVPPQRPTRLFAGLRPRPLTRVVDVKVKRRERDQPYGFQATEAANSLAARGSMSFGPRPRIEVREIPHVHVDYPGEGALQDAAELAFRRYGKGLTYLI